MSDVHRKLGLHKSSSSTGWSTVTSLTGTQIAIAFLSDFETDRATEHFVYRLSSGKAYLVRYDITSPVLNAK
jgi:hypothetical protein